MIPDQAAQAASEAFLRSKLENKGDHAWMQVALLAALEAAAPFMVADAKAEALEEAADHLARLEYVRPDHPNRAAYEKILAVRRGNTDAWLKARAGLIRNPS